MAESSFLNPMKALRAAKLRDGDKVADLGAGSGFFAKAAARLVGGKGVVWAVDAHQDMLPRLRNHAVEEGLVNVEVVHGNIEQEKGSHLPADNFDFVIMTNVLFGAERKEAVVKEAKRILKTGGRALIIDWKDSFDGMGPHKDHVVTEDHARTLMELGGFTFVEDVPAGEFHWGFIARKRASGAAQ
jgi:ubiquinone/menaquinone biosynthesis C-methylase UbiE